MGFKLKDWKAWKAEQDPKVKADLLNQLVKDNLGLVDHLTRKLVYYSVHPCEMEDMKQAGSMGLLNAFERYDPNIASFSTYAYYCVKDFVMKYLPTEVQVKRPKNKNIRLADVRKMEAIYARTGEHATAEEMGITEATMDEWKVFKYHFTTPDDKLVSTDPDTGAVYNYVADLFIDPAPSPEEEYITNELALKVARLRPSMNYDEYCAILDRRFEDVRPELLRMLQDELE